MQVLHREGRGLVVPSSPNVRDQVYGSSMNNQRGECTVTLVHGGLGQVKREKGSRTYKGMATAESETSSGGELLASKYFIEVKILSLKLQICEEVGSNIEVHSKK